MASYLWIGGATDAGKTSLARRLTLTHTLALYEYDRADKAHHERLAETNPTWRDFLDQSLDARWVATTPEALFQRAMRSFNDRLVYVLDDLAMLERRGRPVLAEGFGLDGSLDPDAMMHLIEDRFGRFFDHD